MPTAIVTHCKASPVFQPCKHITENEVNAQDKFASHFLTDYMNGKLYQQNNTNNLIVDDQYKQFIPSQPLVFSPEAQNVFNAGRELYQYYHAQKHVNVNASLYEIKEYFQGRNDKGKLNTGSEDNQYNELYNALKQSLKLLAEKIVPKVYEYGFLK